MKLIQLGDYWINPEHVVALVPAAVNGTRIVTTDGRFDVPNTPDDVAAILTGDLPESADCICYGPGIDSRCRAHEASR